MATEPPPPAQAAPLRLPAILQNPQNRALKQVEAHNAQQREKIIARREKERSEGSGSSLAGRGRGKRFVRRKENDPSQLVYRLATTAKTPLQVSYSIDNPLTPAAFLSNPEISPPTRSDLQPSVPLHLRPHAPSFPPSILERSLPIPSVNIEPKDPYSKSSVNGVFNTSLKGTRAMLRKKGRRVEYLVSKIENEILGWLDGHGIWDIEYQIQNPHGTGSGFGSGWKMIEETLVEVDIPIVDQESVDSILLETPSGSRNGNNRRMPERYRLDKALPSLPRSSPSTEDSNLNSNTATNLDLEISAMCAILELSRSPAHLSWAVMDSFERLVLHLIVRYYELVSWSEDHITTSGELIRLTHIIRPSLVRPIQPSSFSNGLLPTPDNSDLSAPPSSESEYHTDSDSDILSISNRHSSDDLSDSGTEIGTEADESEFNSENGDQTFTQDNQFPDGLSSPTLSSALDQLNLSNNIGQYRHPLQRAISNSSSWYASSEGGSDTGMTDSFTIPRPPIGNNDNSGGWVSVTFDQFESEFGQGGSGGIPLPRPGGMLFNRPVNDKNSKPRRFDNGPRRGEVKDKPSFFEYLYGE